MKHRQVTVGDASLHVIEAGDPAAPPVLFLHGWPQSALSWAPVLELAAETHYALAVDLPESEAMAMLTGPGFQEEGEAAGKWRRALLTSTQLSTYFVGWTEMSQIAASRPFGATPRAWHDAMLAHGSPAPRHLRALLDV